MSEMTADELNRAVWVEVMGKSLAHLRPGSFRPATRPKIAWQVAMRVMRHMGKAAEFNEAQRQVSPLFSQPARWCMAALMVARAQPVTYRLTFKETGEAQEFLRSAVGDLQKLQFNDPTFVMQGQQLNRTLLYSIRLQFAEAVQRGDARAESPLWLLERVL